MLNWEILPDGVEHPSGSDEVTLCTQAGVAIYVLEDLVHQCGRAVLTSHNIVYFQPTSNSSSDLLSMYLPLAAVQNISYSGGFGFGLTRLSTSPKITLHVAAGRSYYFRLSFRDGGASQFYKYLTQALAHKAWEGAASIPPPSAVSPVVVSRSKMSSERRVDPCSVVSPTSAARSSPPPPGVVTGTVITPVTSPSSFQGDFQQRIQQEQQQKQSSPISNNNKSDDDSDDEDSKNNLYLHSERVGITGVRLRQQLKSEERQQMLANCRPILGGNSSIGTSSSSAQGDIEALIKNTTKLVEMIRSLKSAMKASSSSSSSPSSEEQRLITVEELLGMNTDTSSTSSLLRGVTLLPSSKTEALAKELHMWLTHPRNTMMCIRPVVTLLDIFVMFNKAKEKGGNSAGVVTPQELFAACKLMTCPSFPHKTFVLRQGNYYKDGSIVLQRPIEENKSMYENILIKLLGPKLQNLEGDKNGKKMVLSSTTPAALAPLLFVTPAVASDVLMQMTMLGILCRYSSPSSQAAYYCIASESSSSSSSRDNNGLSAPVLQHFWLRDIGRAVGSNKKKKAAVDTTEAASKDEEEGASYTWNIFF